MSTRTVFTICAVFWLGVIPMSAAALPVFPGAEGFGIDTPAGRGGEIYRVTTLAASGRGSLRECVDGTEPRVCVFEVSGYIHVTEAFDIRNPFITIAGETAPSPGVVIRGDALQVLTHDVLVRHIGIMVGDAPQGTRFDIRDGLFIGRDASNIVFDHLTVNFSVDENVNFWGGHIQNVTLSNSIIALSLNDSFHPKGPHGHGMAVGTRKVDPGAFVKRIAIINNLFAHNSHRNPLFNANVTDAVIANNLIYNPGQWETSRIELARKQQGDEPHSFPRVSVVGNRMIPGVNTVNVPNIMVFVKNLKAGSQIYLNDNLAPGRTADEWSMAVDKTFGRARVETAPIWIDGWQPLPSGDVLASVLLDAGTRPWDRGSLDAQVVADVRDGTGSVINCVEPDGSPRCDLNAGGWPALAENTRTLTLPANPNGDDDGDGYTNLEEWLHEMATE